MRLLTRNAVLEPTLCGYKYWQNFGWLSEVGGKLDKASIDRSTAIFFENKHLEGNEWKSEWCEGW
jgi:hypothetical protein